MSERAKVLIQNARAAKSASNTPPAELKALQAQRSEIVLRHRDNFRNAIGEEEFARFSEFIRTEILPGFVKQKVGQGEPSVKPDSTNKGFGPFEQTKTGGNEQ